jgi:hypothetical protein
MSISKKNTEKQMNYINAQDLDKMLQENEEKNLYFNKLKIVYAYELADTVSGDNNIVQKKEQNAYQLKVNDKDVIVTLDEYKDYSPAYMVLPTNDKNILEVKSNVQEIHSVNVERQRVGNLAIKKVGGWLGGKEIGKAFAGNEDLQHQFSQEVKTLVELHMNRYEKQFISKMGEIVQLDQIKEVATQDPEIANRIAKITVDNKTFLSKLSNTFDLNVEKAYENINTPYQAGLKATAAERQQIADAQYAAQQAEAKRTSELQSFVAIQSAKDFTLEKFGYYPVVEFKSDALTVTFNNKDDIKMDTFTLPLKDIEIDFYSQKTGTSEYLHMSVLEDNAIDSISKDLRKKYYHAFFDLKAGLILKDKSDLPYFDEVVDKHDHLLPKENDQVLFANDQFGLVKEMKNNFSHEARLNLVNSELEKDHPKAKKLKM